MKIMNRSVVKGILYGRWREDVAFKYTLISYSFSIVHIILVGLFYALGVKPLYLYGIFSVCLYFFCGAVVTKTKRYTTILVTSVAEVLFHSTLCCYFVGWEYGFMIYALAMIPVLFYLFTITPDVRYPNAYALGSIVIIVICFLLAKLFLDRPNSYYDLDVSPLFIKAVYCANCGIAFFLQTVFSALYTIEIRHFKEKLEEEKNVLDVMASRDPLTNLLNRRAMEPHLHSIKDLADKTGSVFCLIICDIDDFKKVNDKYGHALGDQVLMDIANVFATNLRTNDYVCRWGGEEFLILIPNNKDAAVQVAEKLRRKVEQLAVSQDGVSISVTMTFGISQYIPGKRIETLIKSADDNLYYGKNHGKNQVVC